MNARKNRTSRSYLNKSSVVISIVWFWVISVCMESSLFAAENFSFEWLVDRAGHLAQESYNPPSPDLPKELKDLDYDAYGKIKYRCSHALWADAGLPFQAEFYCRGYLFPERVRIYTIDDNNNTSEVPFSKDLFDYDASGVQPEQLSDDLGFAGCRLLYPINSPDHYNEFISFLGASYFRAFGAKETYGTSARGLAVGMGEPNEEFPVFEAFWIRKPDKAAKTITVYALLNSPVVTGAYRLDISPGAETLVEVHASIFARTSFDRVGAAPLTSMYFYGLNGPKRFKGERPVEHDSDGLLIANGSSEWIWRPLWNSKTLSLSTFEIGTLNGFGLMQRDRKPQHYNDSVAYYHKRPSIWVEPLEVWKGGSLRLLELASDRSGMDNIGACWMSPAGFAEGKIMKLAYRLHFGPRGPHEDRLGSVASTRWFELPNYDTQFEVDFSASSDGGDSSTAPEASITVTQGKVSAVQTRRDPSEKYWRTTFDAVPQDGQIMEIRLFLQRNGRVVTETWSFPWPR